MSSPDYPQEHIFLLKCLPKSDFNTQVKSCFLKDDFNLAWKLCEELESISKSLNSIDWANIFLENLDADTLNYSINSSFLTRYRAIDEYLKTINAKKFESLCAYYVKLLGCDNFKVTRHSSDQGLDFYGTLPFYKYSSFGSSSEKNFLIGQAKLYTSQVGTPEIREFVGSIELLKNKISSKEIYAYKFETELKPYTLISPIFISSSRFSKDAKELCTQAGIRMIDRVKLITLLANVDELFNLENELNSNVFDIKISSVKMAENKIP